MKTRLLDDNTVTAFEGLQAALPKAHIVIIAKNAEDDTLTAIFSRPPVTIFLKPFLDIHIHSRVNFYAKRQSRRFFLSPWLAATKRAPID